MVYLLTRIQAYLNTCVSYIPSNTTVILVGVLFYHGYMFRRLYWAIIRLFWRFTLLLSIYLHFHYNYCTIYYFIYTLLVCLCSWTVDCI
jgi:hypothetical protein